MIKFAYQEGLAPLTIALVRMLIAASLLCPVYIKYAFRTQANWKTHLAIFCLGALNTVQSLLIIFSLQVLSASIATLLLYLFPMITAVLAFFVLNEKLTPIKMGALAGALTGVFLIVYAPDATVNIKGVLLAVGSAVTNSMVMVIIRKTVAGIPPLMSSTGMITWGGLILGIAGLSLRIPVVSGMTSAGLLATAALAIIPTIMAIAFLNCGLSNAEASSSSIIMTMEPLLTAIQAAIFLDERLTLYQSAGGIVIIASLLLLTLGNPGAKQPAPGKQPNPVVKQK